jgi:hypothetical protein
MAFGMAMNNAKCVQLDARNVFAFRNYNFWIKDAQLAKGYSGYATNAKTERISFVLCVIRIRIEKSR